MANGQLILEMKVPTATAHQPAHTVGSLADQLTLKPLADVKEKVGEFVYVMLSSQAKP